jgi:putative Mn2+ efflux pump MntP
VLALLLVALSLGLSNFAAAIGIGVSGISAAARLRVGIIFGLFEAGMPVAGLALGHGLAHGLAHALGQDAHWIGAALLIGTGAYGIRQALRGQDGTAPDASLGTGRLTVTGLALSIDNLAVGFALGTYHVSLAAAAAVIGAVSVALSLAGLEFGSRIGTRAGQRGEIFGGMVLIAVGGLVGAGIL